MSPSVPPDQFHTGIVSEIKGVLRRTHFDAVRYHDIVEAHGIPALELACGDDGPLFELAAAGVDITGEDPNNSGAL